MANASCTAVLAVAPLYAAAVTLFTTPKHVKGKLSFIKVNNGGILDHVITLIDTFTTDPSAGAVAAPQIIPRYIMPVGHGLSDTADEEDLKDIEVLGVLKAYGDATDTFCTVNVGYHFE